jgi:myo-inositol-1(or 4)-monophosphatase
LDLALVADGTYDAYWEQRLGVWDMAAGAVLVEAAGGRLSDYDGGPADVRKGRVVASNGLVHDPLVELLTAARAPLG